MSSLTATQILPQSASSVEAPDSARVHPCVELPGDLGRVRDELGQRGVLQVLGEGGATTAAAFPEAGLVEVDVRYLAPALRGGGDGSPLLSGSGATTIADLWRGRLVSVDRVGPDLRLVLHPVRRQPVGEGVVP